MFASISEKLHKIFSNVSFSFLICNVPYSIFFIVVFSNDFFYIGFFIKIKLRKI